MTAVAASADDFNALTAPHLPRLFRLGMRLTHRPSDSADLVQEALCRAWANWSRFEQGGSVGAYLARILVNAFISRHRHARVVAAVHARGEVADHLFDEPQRALAGSPERDLDDSQLSDEVLAALRSLPRHYRDVVELVDVGGMPYKDAAARLGIPLGTVMSRLHRARRSMRESLRDYARERGLDPTPSIRVPAAA